MKTVFAFLLSAFCFPLFAANPTVIFQSELLTGRAYTNIVVQFDPLPLTLQSNKFIARASVTFTTDWTGSFTNPIVPGTYRVSLGPYTVFTNCIPDTNATIFATDHVCTAATNGFTSAYTRAQSDLRYPSVAGTNITFTTNAGRVVIHSSASGSGGSGAYHSIADGATLIATNPVALRFTNAGNVVWTLVSNAAGASISATVPLDVTNALATLDWVTAISNLANTKQHGSAILSNAVGTGIITNQSQFVASGSGSASNLHARSLNGVDSLALTVNTNTLVVTNGRVGIATNAPAAALEVQGGIRASSGITNTAGASLASGNFTMDTSGNITMGSSTFIGAGVFWVNSANGYVTLNNDTQINRRNVGELYLSRGAGGSQPVSASLSVSNLSLTGVIHATNGINLYASVVSPSAPAAQGALIWTDGTNLNVTVRNGGGTITTNKLTMSAWP